VGVEKDTTMRDGLQPPKCSELESPTGSSESTYRSVAALAAEIGLSERSTRNALRRGEIPHIRVGRRFILPKAAIGEWLLTAGRSLGAEQASVQAGERAKLVASRGRTEVTVMTRAVGRQ
jgi:excisionase family DNA binding protein